MIYWRDATNLSPPITCESLQDHHQSLPTQRFLLKFRST